MAREYAEAMCPVGDYCGGVYDDQRNTDLSIYNDDAKSVLTWLSERFCIVEKSKVKERHKESELRSISPLRFDSLTGIARLSLIESIFGAEMFEEEQK